MKETTEPPESVVITAKFAPLAEGESPVLEVKRHDYQGCQHRDVSVDPELRRITCRTCGEVLDPIHQLIRLAKADGVRHQQLLRVRSETRRLRASIEGLKAEEKRIKSRIRYAKKKEATCSE